MFVLNVICVGILFVSVGILIARLFIQYQLSRMKELEHSNDFRRKLRLVKQLESQQHSSFLLVTSGLFGLVLFLILLSFFQMETQIETVRLRVSQLVEEVQKIKTEQKVLISKVPLRSYPKEGVGLTDISWKAVFEEKKQASLQPKIETQLSQKLAPYFGLSQALVSIDVPTQTLSLSLTGNTENEDNQKMIETNIGTFIEETMSIPKLTQIHIEIVETIEETAKTTYNETLLRKKDNQKFSKLEKTATEETNLYQKNMKREKIFNNTGERLLNTR